MASSISLEVAGEINCWAFTSINNGWGTRDVDTLRQDRGMCSKVYSKHEGYLNRSSRSSNRLGQYSIHRYSNSAWTFKSFHGVKDLATYPWFLKVNPIDVKCVIESIMNRNLVPRLFHLQVLDVLGESSISFNLKWRNDRIKAMMFCIPRGPSAKWTW